jgi:WD40 repeat protein
LLPDDRTLFRFSHRTHKAEFWDITSGKKLRDFDLGPRCLFDGYFRGAVSPDGKRLLTSHSDGFLRLWDLAAGREVWRIPVDVDMRGLTFSGDGRFAAAGTASGACYVWRLPDPSGPYPPSPKTHRTLADGTREHEWNVRIYHTAYSPDGKHYLATADHNQVRVWSADTGELVQVLPGTQCARFTPDGKYVLAVGTDATTIRTWELASGREVEAQRLQGHTKGVGTFQLAADGKHVLSSGVDGTIRLWDLQTGKELGKAVEQPEWPMAVLSPDGKQALSNGPEGTILLWDLPDFKQVRQWQLPKKEILRDLQFLAKPDEGRFVAVTTRAVHWFSLDAAEEVRPALKHDGQPGSTGDHESWERLFPDGRHVILMVDHSLRVIELPSGKERARFEAPADLFGSLRGSPFRLCSPSPDGRWLVAPAEHITKGVGRVYRLRLPGPP